MANRKKVKCLINCSISSLINVFHTQTSSRQVADHQVQHLIPHHQEVLARLLLDLLVLDQILPVVHKKTNRKQNQTLLIVN